MNGQPQPHLQTMPSLYRPLVITFVTGTSPALSGVACHYPPWKCTVFESYSRIFHPLQFLSPREVLHTPQKVTGLPCYFHSLLSGHSLLWPRNLWRRCYRLSHHPNLPRQDLVWGHHPSCLDSVRGHPTAPTHLGHPTSLPPTRWKKSYSLCSCHHPCSLMAAVSPRLWGTSLSFWVKRASPLTPDNLRPLPTVAFFHPPCFLPVSLGIASSPSGITPGSLLPPLPLPSGPLHSGVCCRVGASPQLWSVSLLRNSSHPGALPHHLLEHLLLFT